MSGQQPPIVQPARRRMANRHAAVSIIFAFISFFTLQIFISTWLQWRGAGVRDAKYEARVEKFRSRVANAKPSTKSVVMIGSSRALFGLRGEIVEKCMREEAHLPVTVCNLGQAGRRPHPSVALCSTAD